ncbi:MAG: hypothetical protein P1P86_11705 [Bacteroidales bacterium]|nr:hypothetical protein [Bacteroidales bacterium]
MMKIKAFVLLILIILLTACQSGKNEQENIDKLLERQTQIKERQEAAVENLEELKESLEREQFSLLEERSNKDQEIKRLESDQARLVEEVNKEETEDVTVRKKELESMIKQYDDSVASLKNEMEKLNESLDSITQNMAVYQVQENRTTERLESGVAEIDRRMKNRESRKHQELKKVNLLNKRIDVSGKKMEAYQMERQLYVDERDDLLRSNAGDEELVPFRDRISRMDSIIAAEKKSLGSLKEEKKQAEQFIAETDRVMEDLNQNIHEEYNRQEIIESFIASEKDRLQEELENIRQSRKRMMEEQASFATELDNIDQRMADLDRDMKLIRNREMSDILDRQASMEQTEADLAREEISMLEEFVGQLYPPLLETTDSLSEEMKSLVQLGDEIDSLNALIESEKAEIAGTRERLAEQRARIAEQRARYGRVAGVTVLIIILAGAGMLSLFYFLGKRAKKNK